MRMSHVFFLVVLALAISANRFALSTSTVGEKSNRMTKTSREERVGNRFITLFGARIPVPEAVESPVPHVVDELASHGNIRNHLADDYEKMKQRVTNELSKMQVGQTSSAQDKFPPRTFINKWRIPDERVKERSEAFYKLGLPEELKNSPSRVENMAVGSLCLDYYFGVDDWKKVQNWNLRHVEPFVKSQEALIKQLGLQSDSVDSRAKSIYHYESWPLHLEDIVDMSIGMEFYKLLIERGFPHMQ